MSIETTRRVLFVLVFVFAGISVVSAGIAMYLALWGR